MGKRFAVVAAGVETLATKTAPATEEIGSQIARMHGITGRAVDAVLLIGAAVAPPSNIAAAVKQQSAARREIAGAAHCAARTPGEVSNVPTKVQAAAAEPTGSVARMRAVSRLVTRNGSTP